MNEYQVIRDALSRHSDRVIDLVAGRLAYLGAKTEWSADDNFDTTEDIARLAQQVGLPGAGDQTADGLAFFRAAAAHLGITPDGDI